MAVLVEGLSGIVRIDSILLRFPGGWDGFADTCPNATLCADDKIARVGFMAPNDVKSFIERLESKGLRYMVDGVAADIAVVDQLQGPLVTCDWLEVGHVELKEGEYQVAACRMKCCPSNDLILPLGWSYENSLSMNFEYVSPGNLEKCMKFLYRDGGLDVYLNLITGKKMYVGRTSSVAEHRPR